MVCLLLSHLELHTPGASSSDISALYADAIGAMISTSKADTSSTTQINIGVSQLNLRSLHLESHALAGHVELWTREPLDAVASRVSAIAGEDETTLVTDGPDPRLVFNCPFGNRLMVRRAPPGFTLIGEPAPGGSGECVSLSRIVLGVRQGAAEGIYSFFVTMLGSRCELKRTVSPSGMVAVCFAVAYIGSGQQIIFEERDDERCAPLIEPGARGGEPRPARCALGVYLQSREAYRTAFMACAAAGRLVAATARGGWAEAERTSRFFASIDDTGIELELRSIEHPLCPRGVGRGGIRGCFGAPAVQRVRGVAAAADEHEVPLSASAANRRRLSKLPPKSPGSINKSRRQPSPARSPGR